MHSIVTYLGLNMGTYSVWRSQDFRRSWLEQWRFLDPSNSPPFQLSRSPFLAVERIPTVLTCTASDGDEVRSLARRQFIWMEQGQTFQSWIIVWALRMWRWNRYKELVPKLWPKTKRYPKSKKSILILLFKVLLLHPSPVKGSFLVSCFMSLLYCRC